MYWAQSSTGVCCLFVCVLLQRDKSTQRYIFVRVWVESDTRGAVAIENRVNWLYFSGYPSRATTTCSRHLEAPEIGTSSGGVFFLEEMLDARRGRPYFIFVNLLPE